MTFAPVPAANIAAMIVDLIIAFGLPVALLIVLRIKTRARILPFFLGCVSFVLFALVLENLFHTAVLGSALGAQIKSRLWLYAVYAGFAAGLFEEAGRLVFLSLIMRKDKLPQNALMYGAGHGSVEAMIIVGLSYINNLAYSIAVNAGQAESLLAAARATGGDTAAAALTETFNALSSYPASTFLLAGFERVVAIALHIALSVIVYTAIRRRKAGYWLLAVGLHMLVDAVAVFISGSVSALTLELIVLAMVILIWLYTARLYKAAAGAELAAAPRERASDEAGSGDAAQ